MLRAPRITGGMTQHARLAVRKLHGSSSTFSKDTNFALKSRELTDSEKPPFANVKRRHRTKGTVRMHLFKSSQIPNLELIIESCSCHVEATAGHSCVANRATVTKHAYKRRTHCRTPHCDLQPTDSRKVFPSSSRPAAMLVRIGRTAREIRY